MIPVADREKVIGEKLFERFNSGKDTAYRYWVTDVEGHVIRTSTCYMRVKTDALEHKGLYWRISQFGAVLIEDYSPEAQQEKAH